jgi:oligosaccharide repeat unit polymerase
MPKYFKYLNPTFIVFWINFFAIFSFFITSKDLMFRFAGVNKYFSFYSLFFYFVFLFSFLISSLNFEASIFVNRDNIVRNCLNIYSPVKYVIFLFFTLTFFGYIIWFKDVFFHFKSFFLQIFSNGILSISSNLKEETGFKTLTNFGIGTIILSAIMYHVTQEKIYKKISFILIFFSFFRVFFTAERIALIELLIPITVIILRFHFNLFLKILKISIILFLIIWSTELIRSYISTYYNSKYSPFEYLFYRFTMYFSTSVNNFEILFFKELPDQIMPISTRTLHKFFDNKHHNTNGITNLLWRYGKLEYNNFTAWGELYIDFGYYGILLAAFLGRISRLLYNKYLKGDFTGLFLYPLFILFFLQSYRTNSLVNIRFYATYLILISVFILNKLPRKQGINNN